MDIVRKAISHSLGDIARRYPNNEALVHTDAEVRYNYSLLLWEVQRAARGMIKMGIKRGDRVALWAENLPEWIIAQFALLAIGAPYVPVDPTANQEEVRFILSQSEAKAVIMTRGPEEEHLDAVLGAKEQLPKLENLILISNESHPDAVLWSELSDTGEDVDLEILRRREMEIDPEDPAAIMYTSGTTGKPKGVVLDHLGLLNKSLFSAARQGIDSQDRLCLFFPLFHMFGNTCIALCGLMAGATLVMPCAALDPEKILKAIHKEKCTAIYGSPSMMGSLLEHPKFNKKRWRTLTKGILGGASCPAELLKRLIQDVGVSGLTIAYGSTEASSWITMTHPGDAFERRVSTMGTSLECNQIKIVDYVTGEDLPCNRQGELWTKGLLMKSYYRMPGATAGAVDREGWYHSGDLGEIDEHGYVKIMGRIKDLIMRDGVAVHPTEIENVIYSVPEISEVQVFGFTHPKRGDEVAAWIKLMPGSKLREEDLIRFLEANIDRKKIPKYVKFVSEFPMTRTGKVQKRKLAEMARKEYAGC